MKSTIVLDTARAFKAVGERAIKKVPALRGKTIVNFFIEPSTRTRISFRTGRTAAVRRHHQFFHRGVVAQKRRDPQGHGAEPPGAQRGFHRHPAQRVGRAAFSVPRAQRPASSTPATARTSIRRRRCSTRSPSARRRATSPGLNVTILGDILYSRVARSNIWALTKLGAKVTLCGPSTLVPQASSSKWAAA